MSNKLTIQEGLELDRLESLILKHQEGFLTVASAAFAIRDKKLYRAHYPSWEEYCQKRWGWTQHRANQLIRGAEIVQELPKGLVTTVTTERAARALAKVPKGRRAAVVQAVVDTGQPVNGAAITVAAAKAAKTEPKDVELDSTGYPIPLELVQLWDRAEEVQAVLSQIGKVKSLLKQAQENRDILWEGTNFSNALTDIDKTYATVKASKPFCVCLVCQGHPDSQKGGCRLCKGRGLIGEYHYRTVPEELRKMREKGNKK